MSGQLQLIDSPPRQTTAKKGSRKVSKQTAKQYLLLVAEPQRIVMLRAVVSARFGISYHNGITINTPLVTTSWLEQNQQLLCGLEVWERETYLQPSSADQQTREALESFSASCWSELSFNSVLPVQQTEDWRLLLAHALEYFDPTLMGAGYRAQMLPQP